MDTKNPPADEIDAFLAAQDGKDQLRFITCGSVDDGKSTLLGRLLHDSKTVFEDQLSSAAAESKTYGTQGEAVDLALLVDGLQAEREQGITIDVAYRYFETDKRKFIAADTPGHEQYTRNMGDRHLDGGPGGHPDRRPQGSPDPDPGGTPTSSPSSASATWFWRSTRWIWWVSISGSSEEIVADYRDFAGALGLTEVAAIPISALDGDNVFAASGRMDWYQGPSLMAYLEEVDIHQDAGGPPLPAAGPVGQPAQPRLPGLQRDHHLGAASPAASP